MQNRATIQRLIENSPFSTIAFNRDGSIAAANKAFQSLWNIPANVYPQFLKEYNVLTDTEIQKLGILEEIRRGLKGETIEFPRVIFHQTELQKITKSSSARSPYVDTVMYPVEIGDKTYFVMIHRDVTYQELSTQPIETNSYIALFHESVDPVFMIRGNRIVAANQAAKDVFKLSDAQLKEGVHPGILSPDFQPDGTRSAIKADRLIAEAYKKGRLRFEWVHRDTDGKLIPMEITLITFLIENERALFVMHKDLSVLKKAEADLVEARLYLQDVIESMPSGIIGIDSHGNILQINDQAYRLFAEEGIPIEPEDSIFARIPELSDVAGPVLSSLQEGKVFTKQKMHFPNAKKHEFVNITVYPLHGNAKQKGVIRIDDVTEQCKREQMINQAEKMISLGHMAAGLAHEINNPLAGVLQNLQVLERRLNPEMDSNRKIAADVDLDLQSLEAYIRKRDISRILGGIRESAEGASHLLEKLLFLANQRDRKRKSIQIVTVLNEAVDLAVHDFCRKMSLESPDIPIIRENDCTDMQVMAHKMGLERIFFNLISNALYILQKEKTENPCIWIRCQSTNHKCRILVEDNGPGIPDHEKKRIFDPFFSKKPTGQGAGLGLSVAYMITQNHYGKLSVHDREGGGTVFEVLLDQDYPG